MIMSDSEEKVIAFVSCVAGFLVLPIIVTILKIDSRHVPKIVIIVVWFISAKIIFRIWCYLRGKR